MGLQDDWTTFSSHCLKAVICPDDTLVISRWWNVWKGTNGHDQLYTGKRSQESNWTHTRQKMRTCCSANQIRSKFNMCVHPGWSRNLLSSHSVIQFWILRFAAQGPVSPDHASKKVYLSFKIFVVKRPHTFTRGIIDNVQTIAMAWWNHWAKNIWMVCATHR